MPRSFWCVLRSSAFSALTRALLIVALLLPLVSCQIEPITGRSVLLGLVDESRINAMGVQAYGSILSDSKVSKNTTQLALVEKVGWQIARTVDGMMRENGREPYEWQFVVIDEPTVNAFCLPGGKVAFYSGILDVCQDENGVAVVMGHEIGHAFAQHGRKRVNEALLRQASLGAVNAVLSERDDEELTALTMAALGIGAQLGEWAFSRGDESAADRIGLEIMARAGYDPRPAVDFWTRMSRSSGGNAPPEFLSTHPSHSSRVRQLQEWMPRALEIYEKSGATGN